MEVVNNILSEENVNKMIMETDDDELSWSHSKDKLTPKNQRIVRHVFLNAITNENTDLFKKYPNHPFWRKWTSKKSSNHRNCLDFATASAKNTEWVEVFINMGLEPCHDSLMGCMSRSNDETLEIYKIYKKHDILENQNLRKTLLIATQRGAFDLIEEILERVETRVEGVEKALMARPHLLGRGGFVSHCDAFDAVWDRWGVADEGTLRELSRMSVGWYITVNTPKSIGGLYQKLEKIWNPEHPKWNELDSIDLASSLLMTGRWEEVEEKISNGWDFPYEGVNERIHYLSKINISEKKSSEIKSFLSKIEMKEQVSTDNNKKRKLKM